MSGETSNTSGGGGRHPSSIPLPIVQIDHFRTTANASQVQSKLAADLPVMPLVVRGQYLESMPFDIDEQDPILASISAGNDRNALTATTAAAESRDQPRQALPSTEGTSVSGSEQTAEISIAPAIQNVAHVAAEPAVPRPSDVVFGVGYRWRDNGTATHRALVEEKKLWFDAAKTEQEKNAIAGEIVGEIKSRGGRFYFQQETQESGCGLIGESLAVQKTRELLEISSDILSLSTSGQATGRGKNKPDSVGSLPGRSRSVNVEVIVIDSSDDDDDDAGDEDASTDSASPETHYGEDTVTINHLDRGRSTVENDEEVPPDESPNVGMVTSISHNSPSQCASEETQVSGVTSPETSSVSGEASYPSLEDEEQWLMDKIDRQITDAEEEALLQKMDELIITQEEEDIMRRIHEDIDQAAREQQEKARIVERGCRVERCWGEDARKEIVFRQLFHDTWSSVAQRGKDFRNFYGRDCHPTTQNQNQSLVCFLVEQPFMKVTSETPRMLLGSEPLFVEQEFRTDLATYSRERLLRIPPTERLGLEVRLEPSDDLDSYCVSIEGHQAATAAVMEAFSEMSRDKLAQCNLNRLLGDGGSLEVDLVVDSRQPLGVNLNAGSSKEGAWVESFSENGELARSLGRRALSTGAVLLRIDDVTVFSNFTFTNHVTKAKEHGRNMRVVVCVHKDADLTSVDISKLSDGMTRPRRRDGAPYDGLWDFSRQAPDGSQQVPTGPDGSRPIRKTRRKKRMMRWNGKTMKDVVIPLAAPAGADSQNDQDVQVNEACAHALDIGSSKTSSKAEGTQRYAQSAGSARTELPQTEPLKHVSRPYDNFTKKYLRLYEYEYKVTGIIGHKFVMSHMWGIHKKRFGAQCDENCECVFYTKTLTENVIDKYKLKHDCAEEPKVVGFASQFAPKFVPLLRKKYTNDCPKAILERLYNMWPLHKKNMYFGQICGPNCECVDGWCDVFQEGDTKKRIRDAPPKRKTDQASVSEPVPKKRRKQPTNVASEAGRGIIAGTRGSGALVAAGSGTPKEFYHTFNTFHPLGFYCVTTADTVGLGKCCVIVSKSSKGSAKHCSHIRPGTIVCAADWGKGKVLITICDELKKTYESAKVSGANLCLWFINRDAGTLKLPPSSPNDWKDNGDWQGNHYNGWAGGAREWNAGKSPHHKSQKTSFAHPKDPKSQHHKSQKPSSAPSKDPKGYGKHQVVISQAQPKHNQSKPVMSCMFNSEACKMVTREKKQVRFAEQNEERIFDKDHESNKFLAESSGQETSMVSASCQQGLLHAQQSTSNDQFLYTVCNGHLTDLIGILEKATLLTEVLDKAYGHIRTAKDQTASSAPKEELEQLELKTKIIKIHLNAHCRIENAMTLKKWKRYEITVLGFENLKPTKKSIEVIPRLWEAKVVPKVCMVHAKGKREVILELPPIGFASAGDYGNSPPKFQLHHNAIMAQDKKDIEIVIERQRQGVLVDLGTAKVGLDVLCGSIQKPGDSKIIPVHLTPNDHIAGGAVKFQVHLLELEPDYVVRKRYDMQEKFLEPIQWMIQFNSDIKDNDTPKITANIKKGNSSLLHAAIMMENPAIVKTLVLDLNADPLWNCGNGSALTMVKKLVHRIEEKAGESRDANKQKALKQQQDLYNQIYNILRQKKDELERNNGSIQDHLQATAHAHRQEIVEPSLNTWRQTDQHPMRHINYNSYSRPANEDDLYADLVIKHNNKQTYSRYGPQDASTNIDGGYQANEQQQISSEQQHKSMAKARTYPRIQDRAPPSNAQGHAATHHHHSQSQTDSFHHHHSQSQTDSSESRKRGRPVASDERASYASLAGGQGMEAYASLAGNIHQSGQKDAMSNLIGKHWVQTPQKTRLCHHFSKGCRYGKGCHFLHIVGAIGSILDEKGCFPTDLHNRMPLSSERIHHKRMGMGAMERHTTAYEDEDGTFYYAERGPHGVLVDCTYWYPTYEDAVYALRRVVYTCRYSKAPTGHNGRKPKNPKRSRH